MSGVASDSVTCSDRCLKICLLRFFTKKRRLCDAHRNSDDAQEHGVRGDACSSLNSPDASEVYNELCITWMGLKISFAINITSFSPRKEQ